MADETSQLPESKTRANLAYIWSVFAGLYLGYIIVRWGDQKEILTLVIGLIGGTILGGIFAVYFGGTAQTKKPDPQVPVSGDNPTVNVTNPTTDTDPAK